MSSTSPMLQLQNHIHYIVQKYLQRV